MNTTYMNEHIRRAPDTTCSTDDTTVDYGTILFCTCVFRIINELTFTVSPTEATHTVTGTVSFIRGPSILTGTTTGCQ